ncbi:MAG TPA: cytochrome ubiquinol oxidase subunit I, partial [Dehalococcoidia bacterium]
SGLLGMPRRIYTYNSDMGWDLWNLMATVGAFLIAVSVTVFLVNFFYSLRRGKECGPDPWDARTLEWSIPSPPPEYNFKEIPTVDSRDHFWNTKYREDETGRVVPVLAGGAVEPEEEDGDDDGHGHGIHLPSPSYMPLIASSGFPIVATGLIYDYALVPVGFALILIGLFGWVMEPATEED